MKIRFITEVDSINVDNADCDYFGFPETIYTFGHSKGAQLLMLDLGEARWYLRKEPTQSILIYWDGTVSKRIYDDATDILKTLGVRRFGSLTSFKKPPINVVKTWTWMSQESWENNDIKSQTKHHIRNAIKHFDFEFIPKTAAGVAEATDVLDRWRKVAETRHFMVVYGHYATVIKCHPKLKNSVIIKMTPKGKSKPCGIIGGYLHGERAVLVLSKHDFSEKCAGDALWGKWFQYVHTESGVRICNDGDTSDAIKSKFGLERKPVFRMKRISLDNPTKSLWLE